MDEQDPFDEGTFDEHPILVRLWRDGAVESVHHGSWVLVDGAGRVLDCAGDPEQKVFTRSSIKSLQALPLIESGAADRFGFGSEELALALASHGAEACHLRVVERMLARLDLSVEDLGCGPHAPLDAPAAAALLASGEAPTALHNNCSGKHAGFLALARHLGEDITRYLDPDSALQRMVREAVVSMSGAPDAGLRVGVDGCSAPTFPLPLRGLATALCRVANPEDLQPERRTACRRLQDAVARHPELIAGHHERICTDLARVSGGRLFPKVGAEGIYVIGVRGADRGLAMTIDDGAWRGLHALILHLLERFELASTAELRALEPWAAATLRNCAGREVGRTEVVG